MIRSFSNLLTLRAGHALTAGLLAGGVVLGCGDTGSDVEGTSSTGGGSGAELAPRPAGDDPLPRPSDDEDATPVHGYRVLRSFPHDPQAFTQGLLYADGGFYESTGQYGESSLRFVDLETGKVQRMRSLDSRLFAEGLAMVDRNLIQLTWRNRMALVFNADTLEQIGTFRYDHEGWGLAYDGKRLILSDGTSYLRFYDPYAFSPIGSLRVTDQGRPISQINELEVIGDELWANLWHSDRIARIDLESGEVKSWVDLEGIIDVRPQMLGGEQQNVLNGIAWDPVGERLFVTGKDWPRVFEIEVVEDAR